MMWQVMLYAIGVATALSLMGYCEERLAIWRDMPRRWAWPVTMVVSIIWVVGGILWVGPAVRNAPDLPPVATASQAPQSTTVDAAAALTLPVTEVTPVAAGWSAPSDRTLLAIWAGASGLLILHLVGASALLSRRASRWQRAVVLGREVLVSESTGPALLGTWRPRIVVPQWFMTEPLARQALILQHEEQHMAARDPLLLRAALLVTVALPWNLPLWWQLRRLRQAIEMDCDARVLRQGATPVEYGEVLLAVTQRAGNVPAGLIAMSASSSALEQRIRNFTPDPARHSVLRASAALLFGCLSLGAAGALEAPPLPELRVNPSRQPPQQLVLVPPVLMAATDSVPEAAPSSQRSTAALPRLLPPTDLGEVPSRREAIERAIVQHHPDLVNGPERHGTAFISLWLRADSSVERSELRFVAPGEDAGLDEGDAAAMEKYFDPGSGRLMLAPGWQIADGATLRSQVVVSYRAAPGNLVGGGRLKSRSFSPADVYRVVEGYMPDAYSERRLAAGSIPFLVLSQDGQVLRHGYLEAGFTTNAMESANPDLQLTNSTFLISGGDAAGNGKKRHSVAIAWVVR